MNKLPNLIKNYNIDKGYEDIVSCLQWLRETPQCNGLVTTIGYGLGANLSYLSGLWLDIESSVCYDFQGYGFFKNMIHSLEGLCLSTYVKQSIII